MNCKKSICNLLIVSALSVLSPTFAQNWKPISSAITFKIKHFGAVADGSFKDFSGTIFFDATNISATIIKANIDTKSINTGIGLRDNTLRGNDYFDVEKYPKISMVSTKIEKNVGQSSYTGFFMLTIKGITKNIKIPFTFTQDGAKAVFQGNFEISRTEFGVGGKSLIIGNSVNISILVNTQQ